MVRSVMSREAKACRFYPLTHLTATDELLESLIKTKSCRNWGRGEKRKTAKTVAEPRQHQAIVLEPRPPSAGVEGSITRPLRSRPLVAGEDSRSVQCEPWAQVGPRMLDTRCRVVIKPLL